MLSLMAKRARLMTDLNSFYASPDDRISVFEVDREEENVGEQFHLK